ncbi:6-phosphogluconolactonase [Maribacter sp. 2308TA10-17]|uniref:6-phosphogluconolactonase n=1 Tax=Maribacter sp. 2308TA10-17 TaxID=3386276 RepID=UPI0039BCA8EF
MKFKISKTKQEVALNFSRYLAILIANREEVHIALSGGSTPKIVFDELAANFQEDIDWTHVHLYWGDERCVEPTDNQSNYKMTVEHLISKIDIPQDNIHRIKGENEPEYEAKRYSDVLDENLPKSGDLPQFDLVILGMGDDGHTASIFPHEIELWNSDKSCEVAEHPDSGQKRITITGQVINNAETVVFLVTGDNKAEKYTEIKNETGDFRKYPASLVKPTSKRVLWFLDEAAAGLT